VRENKKCRIIEGGGGHGKKQVEEERNRRRRDGIEKEKYVEAVGRTPWAGDQLVARPLPIHKHRKAHTHTQTLKIHALCGIQTHDPGFRASEDSACLRQLGYRDRPMYIKLYNMYMKNSVFWDITPCCKLKFKTCFGGPCRLHLQGRRRS
jgi:hypothetical protein